MQDLSSEATISIDQLETVSGGVSAGALTAAGLTAGGAIAGCVAAERYVGGPLLARATACAAGAVAGGVAGAAASLGVPPSRKWVEAKLGQMFGSR